MIISVMTNCELENKQIELRHDISDIKAQIEEYLITKRHLGEKDFEDDDWLNKAIKARRLKNHQYQLVCREIGKRNRKAKEGEKKFSDFFVDVARVNLDKQTFDNISTIAKQVMSDHFSKNPTAGLIKVDY